MRGLVVLNGVVLYLEDEVEGLPLILADVMIVVLQEVGVGTHLVGLAVV